MKRTGFKKPTIEQLREAQSAKQGRLIAKAMRKALLPVVRKALKRSKKKKVKRSKLPKASTIRTKCDKLLTPIIKKMYPGSILSGQPTQVAHHHVHKSKSTALRYYIPNLIPLTNAEHQALHQNESFWASKIVQIRGIEWFNDLEEKKNQIVKADVHYYLAELSRLQALHDSL